MRIKIIGDNNCARATRHLLRLAGFAVTEFLPVDAITSGPHAGYAITIDLAPAAHTPDARHRSPKSPANFGEHSHLGPESHAQHHASAQEGATRTHRDASSPAFVPETTPRTTTGLPGPAGASVHFDSVESALEAAVLRHVTQLAVAPVIVDRPGGVVHSDRELRIIAPNTGEAKADEAAAVAIEFGILRGLLDLTAPATRVHTKVLAEARSDKAKEAQAITPKESAKKKWWFFGIAFLVVLCGSGASPAREPHEIAKRDAVHRVHATDHARLVGPSHIAVDKTHMGFLVAEAVPGVVETHGLRPTLLAAEPAQGQFATGQGFKITDGNNFLVVDPCKAQTKSYASINQTASAQLVAGTVSKKIYVCSIHVVVAAATNVAVIEGTGTVCGTGTAGVGGFGGSTAATGWNFAANGGIALGNGDSSLGAEVTSGDNLCIFNSGSGQVSGGISYVVQ